MAVKFERGLMINICEFQKNTPVVEGAGFVDSYAMLLSCKGYLRKRSGVRVLSEGEVSFQDSFELITDFIQNLYDNLRSDLKVIINSRTYTVDSWEQMEEKRFYLKFQLSVKK